MHKLQDPNFCNYTYIDEKVGVCLELGSRRGAITSYWNPLTDDGDALRLAVSCLPFHILKYSAEDYEYCKQDGFAATRRAIVRAAAEIGKVMK